MKAELYHNGPIACGIAVRANVFIRVKIGFSGNQGFWQLCWRNLCWRNQWRNRPHYFRRWMGCWSRFWNRILVSPDFSSFVSKWFNLQDRKKQLGNSLGRTRMVSLGLIIIVLWRMDESVVWKVSFLVLGKNWVDSDHHRYGQITWEWWFIISDSFRFQVQTRNFWLQRWRQQIQLEDWGRLCLGWAYHW